MKWTYLLLTLQLLLPTEINSQHQLGSIQVSSSMGTIAKHNNNIIGDTGKGNSWQSRISYYLRKAEENGWRYKLNYPEVE